MTDRNKTAAARYREILASRRDTYNVTSPSGMEWVLRKITPQDFFISNQLPFQIAQKLALRLQQGLTEADAISELPTTEQMEWLVFIHKLVREAVVSPRIVEHAKEEDEIDFILPEDFTFLVGLVMGGEAAQAAVNFRGRPGADSVAGADSKKRRRQG